MANVDETQLMESLTKEQREAMITRKIEEVKRRNQERLQRHQVIEADRKAAEEKGMAVNLKASIDDDEDDYRPPVAPPKDGNAKKAPKKEKGVTIAVENSQYSAGRGKRLDMMKNGKREEPPKDPGRSFLDDPRREGPLPVDSKKKSSRDQHSFKGRDFNKVRDYVRQHAIPAPASARSGLSEQELKSYESWRQHRDEIDRQRIARQQLDKGGWRREWDVDKRVDPPAPPQSYRRQEPNRRPVSSGNLQYAGNEDSRPPRRQYDNSRYRGDDRGPPRRGGHDPQRSHSFRDLHQERIEVGQEMVIDLTNPPSKSEKQESLVINVVNNLTRSNADMRGDNRTVVRRGGDPQQQRRGRGGRVDRSVTFSGRDQRYNDDEAPGAPPHNNRWSKEPFQEPVKLRRNTSNRGRRPQSYHDQDVRNRRPRSNRPQSYHEHEEPADVIGVVTIDTTMRKHPLPELEDSTPLDALPPRITKVKIRETPERIPNTPPRRLPLKDMKPAKKALVTNREKLSQDSWESVEEEEVIGGQENLSVEDHVEEDDYWEENLDLQAAQGMPPVPSADPDIMLNVLNEEKVDEPTAGKVNKDEDDDDVHNSSSESLERFIQEHTLHLTIGDVSLTSKEDESITDILTAEDSPPSEIKVTKPITPLSPAEKFNRATEIDPDQNSNNNNKSGQRPEHRRLSDSQILEKDACAQESKNQNQEVDSKDNDEEDKSKPEADVKADLYFESRAASV